MKTVVTAIMLLVLCYACKQRVFKYEEYGNENESGKEWHIRYFVAHPPRDTIELHKMFVNYADSLGISLDSLKKTNIKYYTISFAKYTLWMKMHKLIMKEYPKENDNYLGGFSMSTNYWDTTKWKVWIDWIIDEKMEDGSNRMLFLELMNEADSSFMYKYGNVPLVKYYHEMQGRKNTQQKSK